MYQKGTKMGQKGRNGHFPRVSNKLRVVHTVYGLDMLNHGEVYYMTSFRDVIKIFVLIRLANCTETGQKRAKMRQMAIFLRLQTN